MDRIDNSRSPHGERGLKLSHREELVKQPLSLPTRGAWIEIYRVLSVCLRGERRSPHGERGLKCKRQQNNG